MKNLPSFKNYNHIIFHGDYIDGPEFGGSRKIIDIILKSKSRKLIWLEGNHEIRLRRYLGYVMLSAGSGRKDLKNFLYDSIPEDFLDTTAREFDDIDPMTARNYLETLNFKLKMFSLIYTPYAKFICTHSGIRLPGQLDPRYVGSVIYGNRDINKYDQSFSEINKNNQIWSIHAHCQYTDSWEINKYQKVINLDPQTDSEVVFGEQCNNKWKFSILKRE